MGSKVDRIDQFQDTADLVRQIAGLAQTASVEVNVQDESVLEDSRKWLPEGTRLYISHLPGQTWEATAAMCRAVRHAGYEPVPHLPVRLIKSTDQLYGILESLAHVARPTGILLISGDYPEAKGPYSSSIQVLGSGALERYGFTHVSVAGHPEGHAKVNIEEIRCAEVEKAALARAHGFETSVLTQFLFEPEPFVAWATGMRSRGVTARLVCGLAGPAKITTLIRYATRCGVGASIRALSAHTSSLKGLISDHGPDRMLLRLANARLKTQCELDGVHIFCFGGFLRTVKWLHQVGACDFHLSDNGFAVGLAAVPRCEA